MLTDKIKTRLAPKAHDVHKLVPYTIYWGGTDVRRRVGDALAFGQAGVFSLGEGLLRTQIRVDAEQS